MKPREQFLKQRLSAQPNSMQFQRPQGPQNISDADRYRRIREALAFAETSIVPEKDRYTFRKYSGDPNQGDDIGKYQVTEGELKSYAKKYMGRNISASEFQNNPDVQEAYINGKIKTLALRGNTPQQIADIHRRGVTNSSPAGSDVYQDPKYVEIFNSAYLK